MRATLLQLQLRRPVPFSDLRSTTSSAFTRRGQALSSPYLGRASRNDTNSHQHRQLITDNYYIPGLTKADLARLSVVHRSLKVAKFGANKRRASKANN